MKPNKTRDATMAIHMDAGQRRDGKKREIFVLLDAGANVVEVIEGDSKALAKAGYQELPTMGPIDIRPGVYREMLQRQRQGNPEVEQRKGGRWTARESRPLGATIGERTPDVGAMKSRLLRGGRNG